MSIGSSLSQWFHIKDFTYEGRVIGTGLAISMGLILTLSSMRPLRVIFTSAIDFE